MWGKKKASRVSAGRKAKANGVSFENIFQGQCAFEGIVCSRIPDGCRTAGQGRLIRTRTPFDWIISKEGNAALIDTKTIDAAAFPNSLVESHQALSLIRHDMEGIPAGYVVWLRKNDTVIFIPAKTLCQAMQSRGSIGPDDPTVISLGTMRAMRIKDILAPPTLSDSIKA